MQQNSNYSNQSNSYQNAYGNAPAQHGYGQAARPAAAGRERFIVRTYNHLFAAILAFTGIEIAIFKSGLAESLTQTMMQSWYLVMGAFIVVSWLGSSVAHRAKSWPAQYAALAAYVVMEAIVFVPLLYIANTVAPGAIQSAAMVTLLGFAGLTGIAFWTRKDFSFLGGFLRWSFMVALVLIVASLVFGFQLGMFFSVAMVGLAGAAILWDTSNVLHHFSEDRYVAASLQLFASVALMFWYVLRIFIPRD
jgi:uncharacterized protein